MHGYEHYTILCLAFMNTSLELHFDETCQLSTSILLHEAGKLDLVHRILTRFESSLYLDALQKQYKMVKDVAGFSAYAVVPTTDKADAFVDHLRAKDDLDPDNSPLAESESTIAPYRRTYRKPGVSSSWPQKKQDKMLKAIRKRLRKDSTPAAPEGPPATSDSTQVVSRE